MLWLLELLNSRKLVQCEPPLRDSLFLSYRLLNVFIRPSYISQPICCWYCAGVHGLGDVGAGEVVDVAEVLGGGAFGLLLLTWETLCVVFMMNIIVSVSVNVGSAGYVLV